METLEFFKQLRDASGEIVAAMEAEDAEKTTAAMTKFLGLMVIAEALK